MKNIIILTALLIVSCSKKSEESWNAPTLYTYRGEKNIVMSDTKNLDLNDYFYFSDSENAQSFEEIKSKSTYKIKASSTCITNGTTYKYEHQVARGYIQLKEFIPVHALLGVNTTSCGLVITLQNSNGSTKSYRSQKIVEFENFKADFTTLTSDSYDHLKNYQLSSNTNETISFVCDTLSSIDKQGAESISLQEFFENHSEKAFDIDLKQYKPIQLCRIARRSASEVLLSNQFQVEFEKLVPLYQPKIYKGRTESRVGQRLNLYDININNPHPVPVTVGFNKNLLKTTPMWQSQRVGRDNESTVSHPITHAAAAEFLNPEFVSEHGDVVLIHLPPSASIDIRVYTNVSCDDNNCIHSRVDPKDLPVYNLEYNYRTREEAQRANNIKFLDKLFF